MTFTVNGIRIPDSSLARAATELVRDTESPLLFHHSSRVYYFAALAGRQRQLKFDPELLYVGCMFHDMGLTHEHCSCDKRFEVDGANTAREFLHTTPGIPEFMDPVIALVTSGVEMDVLGLNYEGYEDEIRQQIVAEHPRSLNFKEDIIQAFYDGIKHKPQTTFGNVKADVIADKEPDFVKGNFCSVIRASRWQG